MDSRQRKSSGNEKQSFRKPEHGTQKRQRNKEEEKVKPKQKSRRSGGDTIAYLREKNDLVQKWKEEELHLQNQRVEVEDKREDQSRKQHQDMMKVLVEQTKQQ